LVQWALASQLQHVAPSPGILGSSTGTPGGNAPSSSAPGSSALGCGGTSMFAGARLSEQQRQMATQLGIDVNKPCLHLTNIVPNHIRQRFINRVGLQQ